MTKLGVLDVKGTKYTLKLGETYLIGIKSNDYAHDIELDDTSVDIKHCILDFTERTPKLFDIRSKCGTFLDGTRVAVCQMIPLVKSSTIQFGNVEATLQLASERDSGYLEGRLTPPTKDNSEIICNSPENVESSGSRLKHILKNSLTSTPNTNTITNNCLENITKPTSQFLVPIGIPRRSAGSNTSTRSVDSFYIPETQYPVENDNKTNNSTNTSFDVNKFKERSTNVDVDDDDFFIPETQEAVDATCKLSNYPRVAFENQNINETVEDEEKIPSSQFRICTQDFNGSDDDLSNNSDDILANVPCSLIIPVIRHDPVQIEDFLNANNDQEIEKEMSALEWSKRTGDDAENCVTPDDIGADGSVTPDIIEEIEKGSKETISDSAAEICLVPQEPAELVSDEHMENSLKENETPPEMIGQDFQPTQVFIKPPPINKSIAKPSSPPRDKENMVPQEEESSFLPATQVFMPPPPKINSPFAALPPPPPPSLSSLILNDDDLPPTQVFQMLKPVPSTISKKTDLSSTLLDSGMQLSESSFKAKCNKLLDSDDDEMDEVIAPELVKKMRESFDKPKETSETPVSVVIETPVQTPKVDKSSKDKETGSGSKDKPMVTPRNKFLVPTKASKKNSRVQPAVNIDNFLYTPDFLGKEFSKDEQLQKLAEVNWKNIISEKQRKSLFGDENSDGNSISSESDESQDSFNDLLPHKREREKKKQLQPEKPVEKVKKSNDAKERVEEPGVRITRRKSGLLEQVKPKKIAKKTTSESNLKPITESKTRKDVTSRKGHKNVESTVEKNNEKLPRIEESKDNMKKSHEEKYALQDRERIKLRRITFTEKSEKNDEKRPRSRVSEKAPKDTSTAAPKRTTRQSPKMLDNSATKLIHHNENIDLSRKRSKLNIVKDAIDSRIEFNQKRPENLSEEKDKKQLKISSKDSTKSSTKQSSGKGTKDEKFDAKKRKETKSRALARIEPEEKPAPRLTRLRSGMDLSSVGKTETAVELTNGKKVTNRANENNLTRKDESADKKNRSQERLSKTIDLTNSDIEDSNKHSTPNQANTNDSTRGTLNAATTTKVAKRKNEVDESNIKRQRKMSSTDSGKSFPILRKSQVPKVKIAMTMCDPRYQDVLEKHSGALWLYTNDPKVCDVLVVERGNRTYKLMVAIARGIPVVKLEWLIEVLSKKSVEVPYERFIFDDKHFQERHQFVMKKSLTLAKAKSLFDGIGFMVTPGIRPVPDEMKDIITCAGGTVLEDVPKAQPNQKIYLVSQQKDNQHWHRYRRSNSNIKIVSSEGVMASVMQQSEDPLIKSIIQ